MFYERRIKRMKKKLMPLKFRKDKRGVLGLETVKAVMITFMILAVLGVSIVIALVSLRDSGVVTAGTSESNQTTAIIENVTAATSSFFSNTSTIYSILVVVVIILAIAIIIAVVTRFGGGRSTATV